MGLASDTRKLAATPADVAAHWSPGIFRNAMKDFCRCMKNGRRQARLLSETIPPLVGRGSFVTVL